MSQINLDDLTLGQIKQLQILLGASTAPAPRAISSGLNSMVGELCIIRTYAAGVWFGTVAAKDGNEVIVKDARRMWQWKAKQGISLSACALYGIDHAKSKIIEPVESVWLEAIELIPCSSVAIDSISGAPHVEAQ